jgi:hypothetical protein
LRAQFGLGEPPLDLARPPDVRRQQAKESGGLVPERARVKRAEDHDDGADPALAGDERAEARAPRDPEGSPEVVAELRALVLGGRDDELARAHEPGGETREPERERVDADEVPSIGLERGLLEPDGVLANPDLLLVSVEGQRGGASAHRPADRAQSDRPDLGPDGGVVDVLEEARDRPLVEHALSLSLVTRGCPRGSYQDP